MSTNRRVRESPPETPGGPSARATSYKKARPEEKPKATSTNEPGGNPRQEIARHQENRDSTYTTRSHKSIPTGLPDSSRTDSREQLYDHLNAWEGMSHE